jgi:hypothetical protein
LFWAAVRGFTGGLVLVCFDEHTVKPKYPPRNHSRGGRVALWVEESNKFLLIFEKGLGVFVGFRSYATKLAGGGGF